MFSKILVKLIDQAILPAFVLIAARVISVFLIARYGGINFTLGPQGFVYQSPQDFLIVNSYSTLAMIAILLTGLLFILLKSLVFHETHITPAMTAKLFSLRLSYFIQSSYDLYSQGVIWLSYLYLITAASGVMGYFGMSFMWVFWASLAISIVVTVLFILDVENELSSKVKSSESLEEVVLEFEKFDE